MNKKYNAEQLTRIILNLPVGGKIDVRESIDNLSFAIEKMNWNDSHIILFGGYSKKVKFVDVSEMFYTESEIKENILNMVKEHFEEWGIDGVTIDR